MTEGQNNISVNSQREMPMINKAFLLSRTILNLQRNGPVVTNDNPPIFNDRYDANKKWYRPDFILQQPLQNSFQFLCFGNGVDKDANTTYGGVITFNVIKQIPEVVNELMQNPGSVTYEEIALNSLTICFTVTLVDKSVISYPGVLTTAGNQFTLSINIDQQEALIRFYKFISNPANKDFCSLTITATYFGYIPRPKPIQLQNYRQAFLENHLQMAQPTRRAPMNVMTRNFVRPGLVPRVNTENSEVKFIRPVPQDDYDPVETIPFIKVVNDVNYDCHLFPGNYLTKDSTTQTTVLFACHPPFGDVSSNDNTYCEFNIITGSLNDHNYGIKSIYLNTYNGNFLVIPERYLILLEDPNGTSQDDQLIPSAYLTTFINLEDVDGVNKSTANLKFNIAPDISSYQLVLIQKLIFQNIPKTLNKTFRDILIDFPEKIHQPLTLAFNSSQIKNLVIVPMGKYKNGVPGSNYFHLEFQNVPIGDGTTGVIVTMLKTSNVSMIDTLVFDVDSEVNPTPQSAVMLSLYKVTGNGLLTQKSETDDSVYFINKTLYDITIDSVLADDEQNISSPLLVSANNFVNAAPLLSVADLATKVVRYSYSANPNYIDQVLNEIRFNAGQVSDEIIVTNNTGLFPMFKITQIDIVISIIKPGETDPTKALMTTSKSIIQDGVINHIPFTLPVTQYLSKWSAVYSTVISFSDKSQQANEIQLIEDLNSIGKIINLTITNLNLHSS